MRFHRIVTVLVFVTMVIAPASSAEIVLQPGPEVGKDAWVRSGSPDINNGNDANLHFGASPTFDEERHLYLEFDLTGFAAGTVIEDAWIEFYMHGQNGWMAYKYGVYPVLEDWDEQTVTWSIAPNISTDPATKFDGADWQGNWDQWHIIPGLAGLAQSWVDAPAANHGIMIKAIDSSFGEPYIYSSDSGNADLRPRLVVNGPLVPNEAYSWGYVKALYRAAR